MELYGYLQDFAFHCRFHITDTRNKHFTSGPWKQNKFVFFVKSFILSAFTVLSIAIQYAGNETQALFWHKYYMLAMIVLLFSFVVFYSLIIESTKFGNTMRWILYIYIGIILVIWVQLPYEDFCGYGNIGGFWIVNRRATWFNLIIFSIYIMLVPSFFLYFIWKWYRKADSNKKKNHSRIILLSTFTVYLLSFGTDFIIMRFYSIPHMTPFYFFIYLASIYYALVRYYFLDEDLGKSLIDMLENSRELFFFMDKDLLIKKVNSSTIEHFGEEISFFIGKPFMELLADESDLSVLRKLGDPDFPVSKESIIIRYKTSEDSFTVRTSLTRVVDKFGDFVGIYALARSNSEIKVFQTSYGISPKQMEVLFLLLKGLTNMDIGDKLSISRRTVETHISAIYGKLNVSNKIELMNLASNFEFMN